MAILQNVGGNLEMWPFTYFGMYKGTLSKKPVVVIDVLYTNNGKTHDTVFVGENGYYVCDEIRDIITGSVTDYNNRVLEHRDEIQLTEEKLEKIRRIVRLDIVPMLQRKNMADHGGVVSIRVQRWSHFSIEKRFSPDTDIVVFSAPLGDLI